MGKFREIVNFLRRSGFQPERYFALEGLESRRLLSGSVAAAAPATNNAVPASAKASVVTGMAGLNPTQVATAYGFNTVGTAIGATGGNGAGQTIALVESYSSKNLVPDLHVFDQQFGIVDPDTLTQINQFGGATLPAANDTWSQETALDVEWAHAVAPAAHIVVVEAQSDELVDLLTAVDTARRLPGVSVVSMSWGVNEFAGETALDYLFTAPAGHQPITFVASSGDRAESPTVQWPATSPSVLSVGGTSLALNSAGAVVAPEAPWLGAAAGLSAFESQPSYQNEGARVVPDVVYNANPAPGFAVYDSALGGWQTIGGTSAGAPQWAALVAIANQARATQNLTSLDGGTQTLPKLYDYYRTTNQFTTVAYSINANASGTLVVNTPSGMLTSASGAPQAGQIILQLAFVQGASYVLTNSNTYWATVKTTNGAVVTMGPAVPVSIILHGKTPRIRVHPFTLMISVRPTDLLSAAGFGGLGSGDHDHLRAVAAVRVPLTGVASTGGSRFVSAPASVDDSLLASALSASAIVSAAPTAIVLRAFNSLLFAAPDAFADTEVVPVGAGLGPPSRSSAPLYIAHFNISASFCDAVAAFISECAARPQTLASLDTSTEGHSRAWTITGAVVAIDAIVLTNLIARRRVRGKSCLTSASWK